MIELLPETATRARQERVIMIDEHTDRVTVNLDHADVRRIAQIRDLISLAIGELHAALLRRAAKRQPVKLATCSFRDRKTGAVCGGSYMMESDHVTPRALGGEDGPENRRPLCRVHNQLEAETKLGPAWANAWRAT